MALFQTVPDFQDHDFIVVKAITNHITPLPERHEKFAILPALKSLANFGVCHQKVTCLLQTHGRTPCSAWVMWLEKVAQPFEIGYGRG